MPVSKTPPFYKSFNNSLEHLHLPLANSNKLFHVFKWSYNINKKINYPLSRQDYFDITFFVKAKFTHHLSTDSFPIVNHSLHILTPGQAEWFETQTLNRPMGYSVYFKASFLFGAGNEKILADLPFLQAGNRNTFYFSKNQSLVLQDLFSEMIAESDNTLDDFATVKHYLLILLYKIKQFQKDQFKENKNTNTKAANITQKFQKLIYKTYLSNRTIKSYALQLNITAKVLNGCVQKETGKTPKRLLLDVILEESKVLLNNRGMSVSEIAYYLNFHDNAHFVKFFRKATGMTPQKYKENA